MTPELWNSDDCAAFFRCSRRHFMERIATHPGFPAPIRVPTLGGRSRPLWSAAVVRGYVEQLIPAGSGGARVALSDVARAS